MELDSKTFEKGISEGLVIIDFWAAWCGPCVNFGPIFGRAKIELKKDGLQFFKVDIDANPTIAADYGIRSIPTILAFKDGKEIDRKVGGLDFNSLKAWVLELENL